MLLTEYQSKTILQRHGIDIPPGKLVSSAEEAAALAAELGSWPLVLKAQIPAGGRARGYFESPSAQSSHTEDSDAETAAVEARDTTHGGIRIVNSAEQTEAEARNMLGRNLVTRQTGPRGRLVRQLYLEAHAQIKREFYIALTIDAPKGCIVFLASDQGGTLVEQASQSNPQAIASIALGADALQVTEAAVRLPTAAVLQALSLDESHGAAIEKLLSVMLHVFVERDATLVEINPFGFAADGELIILDAAIQWDDNSLFRQGHEEELVAYESLSVAEHDARVARLNYHDLDGNIGTLGFGAAVAMATNDALLASGGKAANFLDVAPSADVDRIRAGVDVLLANSQVDAILINAFGGGILRCTSVCDALLQADAGQSLADCGKPVVVRLAGVEAEAARQQLKASLPAVTVCTDLRDAVEAAVELAGSLSVESDKKTSAKTKVSAVQRLRALVFGSSGSSVEHASDSKRDKSAETEGID